MIKSPKDHAWRDMIVHMIVEASLKLNFESKSRIYAYVIYSIKYVIFINKLDI